MEQPFTDFGDIDIEIAQGDTIIDFGGVLVLSSAPSIRGASCSRISSSRRTRTSIEPALEEDPGVIDFEHVEATTREVSVRSPSSSFPSRSRKSRRARRLWINTPFVSHVALRCEHGANTAGVFRIALSGPGNVNVRAPASEDDEQGASTSKANRRPRSRPRADRRAVLRTPACGHGRGSGRSQRRESGRAAGLPPLRGRRLHRDRRPTPMGASASAAWSGSTSSTPAAAARRGRTSVPIRARRGDGEVFVLDDVLTASSASRAAWSGRTGSRWRTRDGHGAGTATRAARGRPGRMARHDRGMYPCEYGGRGTGARREGARERPPRGALVSVGVLSARAPEGRADDRL